MPCCPPGKSVCNTQLPAARSDLDWSAAAARVLFDGDDAIVCNTVRKSARRGQRPLPAAAARVLCGRTLTAQRDDSHQSLVTWPHRSTSLQLAAQQLRLF